MLSPVVKDMTVLRWNRFFQKSKYVEQYFISLFTADVELHKMYVDLIYFCYCSKSRYLGGFQGRMFVHKLLPTHKYVGILLTLE